jgi:F-type H+-transporting ATPase subunit b
LDKLAPLGINLGYLLSQAVNFFILFFLLRAVLYKPLLKMMDDRRDRIAEGVNNARRAEEALASAEADKQAVLDEARAEAQRVIAEARQRAEETASQIKAEARDEATRIVNQARDDAGKEQEMLLTDMREQIVSLSMAAAHHLIGKSLDAKRQKEVVKDFFSAVPAEAKVLSGNIEVITAVPLTDAEKNKFKTELKAETITFVVDSSILGGVVVRAGGRQVDASFANQLQQMRVSMS